MDKTPSSEIQERLRALCKQITVAEEIDPEIQEELMSHVEDRFNGYLHGKDPITEEDAFLLVREHFGNPAVVKELLQHAHVEEATVSLGRRLAAIAALNLGCYAVAKLINLLVATLHVWTLQWVDDESIVWAFLWNAQNLAESCLLTAVIWIVIVRWSRHLNRGKGLWICQWSKEKIVVLLFALAAVVHITPHPGFVTTDGGGVPTYSMIVGFMGFGLGLFALVIQATAWLWWCDSRPRTKRSLLYATLTWVFIGTFSSTPGIVASIPVGEPSGYFALLTQSLSNSRIWWFSILNGNLTGASYMLVSVVVSLVAVGIVARFVYWLACNYSRRRADNFPAISQ